MKKYILAVILTTGAILSLNAQVSISYSAGYGNYKMEDMNRLLELSLSAMKSQLPPAVRITDNFPGYITHNIDAAYRLKRHEVGLKGTYMTTGGKIAYADYSGKYHEKFTLNGFRLGLMYRFHFAKIQMGNLPLSFYGELSPAVTFTSLKYAALLDLPDYDVHETNPNNHIGTKEKGFSIHPLIGTQLQLSQNIFISCNGGYDFEFGAKLSTTKDQLRVDWSGFRANLGLGFIF